MSGLKRSYYISPATIKLLSMIYGYDAVRDLNSLTDRELRERARELNADLRGRIVKELLEQTELLNQLKEIIGELRSGSVSQASLQELQEVMDRVEERLAEAERRTKSAGLDTSPYTLTPLASTYLSLRVNREWLENARETARYLQDLSEARKRLTELRAEIDDLFREKGELMRKWFPERYQELRSLSRISEGADLQEVQESLASALKLREALGELSAQAERLEASERARDQVVEALRKTCAEMGWKEVEPPHLEDPSDLRSDVIYKVNTYSAGEMTFRISLERIEVDSPFELEGGFCLKQFETLSQKLRELGINTSFKKVEADDEDPILLKKGALDLPEGGAYEDYYYDEEAYGYEEI